MVNFFLSYTPDPVAFSIGGFDVRWYGILISLSILIGYWITGCLAKREEVNRETALSVYVNAIIWGIIGARVYHILLDASFYFSRPAQIFAVWNGGLAIHGAVAAGVIVLLYYVKKYKISFYKYADLFALPMILGQAIGRWGNYFNQELFGKPTGAPWGIFIDPTNRPVEFQNAPYFHPAFLYESLWNFSIFIILFFVFKSKNKPNGLVFWLYIALYSLGRSIMEFIRIEPTPELLSIRAPLAVSLLLFLIGSAMIARKILQTRAFVENQ